MKANSSDIYKVNLSPDKQKKNQLISQGLNSLVIYINNITEL